MAEMLDKEFKGLVFKVDEWSKEFKKWDEKFSKEIENLKKWKTWKEKAQ
jgi:hypothetical protein